MSRQGGGSGGFLAGIAVGVMAGVAVGLLLAPRSGEETRETLVERGIELRGRILEGEAGPITAEITSRPASVVEEYVERLRSYLLGLIDQARQSWRLALEQGRREAARTERSMLDDYQRQVGTSRSW